MANETRYDDNLTLDEIVFENVLGIYRKAIKNE